MSAVLIISLLLLAATVFAIHLGQRKPSNEQQREIAPPRSGGLFGDPGSVSASASLTKIETNSRSAELREALLARAARGDKGALSDAHASGDAALYSEVLDALVARESDSRENLRALASHITQSDRLRANAKLAAWLIEAWRAAPERRTLAEVLHIAALTDDAATFQRAVEISLAVWRDGRLPRVSAKEFYALVENEYWVLAPEARRSGAGFVLKRTLVSVRRELATAARRASG